MEQRAESREHGAWSREQGVWCREQRAWSILHTGSTDSMVFILGCGIQGASNMQGHNTRF
ncbi:MAG: hypothetical protein AMS27_15730 [Bacteroides sp. SM23_62_1]|nr:MAG: hypothetical protein AMS27_15730 [Bacteroides sp. SM23_62_1]